MGFGSSPSYDPPEVTPVPEKQATKSVSAGATAAAEAQKDRQRKNRGLASSIMTARGAMAENETGGNATLG